MPRDRKSVLKRTERHLVADLRRKGLTPAAAKAEAKERMKAVRKGSFWHNEKDPSP